MNSTSASCHGNDLARRSRGALPPPLPVSLLAFPHPFLPPYKSYSNPPFHNTKTKILPRNHTPKYPLYLSLSFPNPSLSSLSFYFFPLFFIPPPSHLLLALPATLLRCLIMLADPLPRGPSYHTGKGLGSGARKRLIICVFSDTF